jgi:hypothetical protein
MTTRKFAALAASASAIVLVFAATEASARTAGAPAHGAIGAIGGVRPFVPHGLHGLRHHHGRDNGGAFWPGYGDGYGAYPTEPMTAPLRGPNEVHYTYTYDVPWDWAHRFPPNVTPSDRPYVPGCGSEAVDVGGGKTVNVIRCY